MAHELVVATFRLKIPQIQLCANGLKLLPNVCWVAKHCEAEAVDTNYFVEFKVITEVTFYPVPTPCNSERFQRFGGAYRLHLHGLRVIKERKQPKQAVYSYTLKMEAIFSSELHGDMTRLYFYQFCLNFRKVTMFRVTYA
jgi:hypothetical protein